MASTTIIDYYSIGNTDNEIILEVRIKQAQISRSTVRLNKQLIGEYDDSFTVSLGKVNDIMGSVLYIDTTEADINPDDDVVSFTVLLKGGVRDYQNQRMQTVNPGGYILYTAEIALIP